MKLRVVAIGAAVLLGLTMLVAPTPDPPATAAITFPSWQDIQNAKQNEQSKQSEISRVQGLIATLQRNLETAQANTDRLNAEYDLALATLNQAQEDFDRLSTEALDARDRAARSKQQAGALIAQMVRTGGTDVSVDLVLSGDSSQNLLYGLSTVSRLSQQNDDVYQQASADQKLAESLTAQAKAKKIELDRLAQEANAKLQAAQAAQAALTQAVADQKDNQVVLAAQLASLKDTTKKLSKARAIGLEKQRLERIRLEKIRREKARQARLAAQRRAEAQRKAAAAYAAAHPSSNSGSSYSGSVSSTSRVRLPLDYFRLSSGYGYRSNPTGTGVQFHAGLDFAAPGGTPIHAVASGVVVGVYVNYARGYVVDIRHNIDGRMYVTRYQHMRSQAYVSDGQHVNRGQVVGAVGMTGDSTGNHLHFEVLVGGEYGYTINPRTWLQGFGLL